MTNGVVPSSWTIPVLLGIFFLSVYLVTGSSDLMHNGDTDLRYQTTQALVDHHHLWLARPMWVDTRISRGRGGHQYVFYAPGQILAMVPLYVAGKVLAHHLSLPYDVTTLYASRSLDLFLGAVLAVLFFFMAESVGYSRGTAVALTLIFGLATAAWPDAQSALEQTQVNVLLLLTVFLVWRSVQATHARRGYLALAGCGIGAAVFTRYDAALFIPIVFLFPATLRIRAFGWQGAWRDAGVYALGVAPWIAGIALWNDVRFGNIVHTGLRESTWGEPLPAGLLGLLISPGKGLLWYVPLVLLLPWAVPRFYARLPALTLFFAALVLVPLFFYANLLYWHGDPAWGPRYLYTSIPYLILPLGELLARWSRVRRSGQAAMAGLILWSLAIQSAAVSVTQWRFWYRLQAAEERTSQPFRWGAQYYHYYWNPGQAPILVQFDDLYQVIRLTVFHDQRYRFVVRPTACDPAVRCVSNPADNYPINSLAFWWADTRHPLLGDHTRYALALLLAVSAALSITLLYLWTFGPRARGTLVPHEREYAGLRHAGG